MQDGALTDIPLCEPLDEFTWDPDEVRELIRTTTPPFSDDGLLSVDDAGQLSDLEGSRLTRRSW